MDSLHEAGWATPGLELLLLLGSRARTDANAGIRLEFSYLDSETRVAALVATIVELNRERSHRLRRGSSCRHSLLRYRGTDGRPLHEARPGIANQFCFEAVRFWCDAAPVLEREYDNSHRSETCARSISPCWPNGR